MHHTRSRETLLVCCLLSLGAAACVSWEEGWKDLPDPAREGDVAPLLEKARQQTQNAGDRKRLAAVIASYEAVLAIDPRHRDALANLAQYHILMGTGYSQSSDDKEQHFTTAIRYSERLMYLNPKFKSLVDRGETVWDSSRVLGKEDADAMGWWTTGVFYYFKECISDAMKIFNVKWVKRTKQVMERIAAVAPEWNGGANDFNLGIYYLAVPESLGGDMEKAAESFNKARAAGPDRLLIPWGRAKYYHYKKGDRTAFKKDLDWVMGRDPRDQTGDPYPWNVYFQNEARTLLASIDDLF
jgi:tetratricopeptide (TPR) repeat protein